MKTKMQAVKLLTVFAVLLGAIIFSINSYADHSWNNYHWARTSNPFTLKVVDSNTLDWDDNLTMAMVDWSTPVGTTAKDYMDLVTDGLSSADDSSRTRKRCPMVSGKIRSCNAEYGFNGWLGLASINVSGDHITQGTSKMNDSYLKDTTRYDEDDRQHVMCQEIGHDFGLGHQDESGADLNTCKDYAKGLGNPKPNSHDYLQIEKIYGGHLDSSTTIAASSTAIAASEEVTNNPNSWGQLMRQSADGRSSTYVKEHSNGSRTITHVFWTEEAAERCPGCDHRYHDVH